MLLIKQARLEEDKKKRDEQRNEFLRNERQRNVGAGVFFYLLLFFVIMSVWNFFFIIIAHLARHDNFYVAQISFFFLSYFYLRYQRVYFTISQNCIILYEYIHADVAFIANKLIIFLLSNNQR